MRAAEIERFPLRVFVKLYRPPIGFAAAKIEVLYVKGKKKSGKKKWIAGKEMQRGMLEKKANYTLQKKRTENKYTKRNK